MAEKDMNPLSIAKKRIAEDTVPTFDYAWQELKGGKPARFLLKAGSVTAGALLMTDGIYHILTGYDEEVEDIFIDRQTGRNHVRMFAGATELFTGAAALYLGLTKGPRVVG